MWGDELDVGEPGGRGLGHVGHGGSASGSTVTLASGTTLIGPRQAAFFVKTSLFEPERRVLGVIKGGIKGAF